MLVFRESERDGVKQVAPKAGWLAIVKIVEVAATPAPKKRRRFLAGGGDSAWVVVTGASSCALEGVVFILLPQNLVAQSGSFAYGQSNSLAR